jgi:O-antigen/teichoic acid export membrane protein
VSGASFTLRSRGGSLSVFAGRAAASLTSFTATVYLAGILGAHQFGRYSLALAILTFSSLFMDLGYFASGARLVAGTGEEELRRGYIGGLFVIGAIASALFVGVTAALAVAVDRLFGVEIATMLLAVAWAAPALIAPLVLDQVLKASGRIHLLGASQALPRVLFLAAIFVAGASGRLDAQTALALFLLTGLIAAVLVSIVLRPSVRTLGVRLRDIAAEQQRFGRHLYAGKLANLATYNLDRLLLGVFRDVQVVGYYSLAMSFSGLVTMFGQSVAAAGFRDFAHRHPISPQLLQWNRIGILITSLLMLILGQLVVGLYLGPSYSAVVPLLALSIIASACQAAYQPYNSWLLANGFGVELKRFLLVVAAINIVANFTLIPVAGGAGAAIASGVGTGAYLILSARIYRQQLSSDAS